MTEEAHDCLTGLQTRTHDCVVVETPLVYIIVTWPEGLKSYWNPAKIGAKVNRLYVW